MRNPDKELLDGIKAIRDASQPHQDQMTLRDQFAMAALNAFIPIYIRNAGVYETPEKMTSCLVETTYEIADAMMEAREPK